MSGSAIRLQDLAVDPYPTLARLRATSPVAWIDELQMWFVTRRADVLAVLRDAETYRTDAPRSTIRDTFGPQMLSAEGDQHRRYKSHCNAPFNARSVRDHAVPLIAARVATLLDRVDTRVAVDLRPALASPLAVFTVGAMLGIPESMHATIRGWYDDFAVALANFTGDTAVRVRGRESAREFREAVTPVLRALERQGDQSLLAVLGRAASDRLTDEEILSNALIVLFGGIETTESTILNVIWTLLSHPEALADARRDPAHLSAAIEEAIRWEPAVQSCTRHVARAVTLAGIELAPDAVVQCMIGGANRDPAHFEDPDRYDPARSNAADHVSFGAAKHYCLGAALARAEVEVVVETLWRRWPRIGLDPHQPSAPRGYEFRAPPTLHAILEP